MSNRLEASFFQLSYAKALKCLSEDDFTNYVEELALLGSWVQQNWNITQYKNNEDNLNNRLIEASKKIPIAYPITPEQELALTAFQTAWRDENLARVKRIIFTRDATTSLDKNTCLLVKETDGYKIMSTDADGNPALMKVDPDDDIAEIAQKLPDYVFNIRNVNDKRKLSPQETDLTQRLLKAIRNLNKETLDQKSLAAKANLDKEVRHRIKLGLEAFNFIFNETQEKGKSPNEEKSECINLQILDKEPTQEEISHYEPQTYVVIKPRADSIGHAFFYKNNLSKKLVIKDSELHQALHKLEKKDVSIEDWNRLFNERIRNLILEHHCRQLDMKAQRAISHYKTRSQKATTIIGSILAALTAFAYGTVELVATMVGFFIAAGIVWTNPLLALGGALLLAAAVILPIPTTWTDWKVFSTYVPGFLDNIRKEYKEINSPLKKGLFWGLSLFAVATGMAAGGLAYTSTIALPALMGLGAIGAIFPPIGIFLAAAVMLCQTFSMIRSFTDLLRKENSWKAFKKPFLQVNKILRGTNASWARRIFTWAVVVGLTALSVLGLVMSCFTSTRSVGKFFIDQLQMAPERALAFGIAISGFSSFISRVYFTVNSAIIAGLILCKRALKANPLKVFTKNHGKYDVISLAEDVSPENYEEFSSKILTAATLSKKNNVVIVTGINAADKSVYFVKNKKIINTEKSMDKEKSILKVSLKLDEKKSGLVKSEGLIEKTANPDAFEFLLSDAIAAGEKELIAHEKKLYPIPLKKAAAIGINSAVAGAFYMQNMLALSQQTPEQISHDVNLHLNELSSGAAGLVAATGLITAGGRYVAINLKHVDEPEDPYEVSRKLAAKTRIEKNIKFFREKNPHSIFAASSAFPASETNESKLAPSPSM